jgi:hypothetical protein
MRRIFDTSGFRGYKMETASGYTFRRKQGCRFSKREKLANETERGKFDPFSA